MPVDGLPHAILRTEFRKKQRKPRRIAHLPSTLVLVNLLLRNTVPPQQQQQQQQHALDVLGDPVRRRILEILAASGECAAGTVVEAIQREFGISQAGVSQHLKVLRESGFAQVRVEGTRRVYSVDSAPFRDIDSWLEQFRGFWGGKLNALTKEIARGKRDRSR
ncbi:MAG: winged helix-turn-helix transcriptional regulator [Acidobacteria bacterium]|nr:winged helix-turn-helix transcriptional regulator [Acidobacteriota bacterium]